MGKIRPVSDLTLRQFELKWRETGAVEDEVTYLQELRRAKRVDKAGLKLAAQLGSQAARLLLKDEAPEAVEPWADLMGGRELPWDDPPFAIRAALAAGPALVSSWEEIWPDSRRAKRALDEARALCRSKHAAKAQERKAGIEAWRAQIERKTDADPKFVELTRALLEVLEAACRFALEDAEVSAWEAVQRAFWVLGKDTVEGAIKQDLIDWALGYRDPLAG